LDENVVDNIYQIVEFMLLFPRFVKFEDFVYFFLVFITDQRVLAFLTVSIKVEKFVIKSVSPAGAFDG
jgi:hypothetical protein